MKKKIEAFLVCMLLIVSSIVFVFPVESVNVGGNTLYVDDDNKVGPWNGTHEYPYKNIRDGIENASNGDTVFVYNGNYFEKYLYIDRSIELLGEDKNNTFINPVEEQDWLIIMASSVVLSGFTFLKNFYLCLWSNNNQVNIMNNIFNGSEVILLFENSNNHLFTNNIVTNCRNGLGILEMGGSSGNYIRENTFQYNDIGVVISFLYPSGGSTKFVKNNFIANNLSAFFIIDILMFKSIDTIYNKFGSYIYNIMDESDNSNVFNSYETFKIMDIKNRFNYKDEYWDNNYWDDLKWDGPKLIPGLFELEIGEKFSFYIPCPWFECDWHPAEEPYDIP